MLAPEKEQAIVDIVRRDLYTPLGLRSLSPRDYFAPRWKTSTKSHHLIDQRQLRRLPEPGALDFTAQVSFGDFVELRDDEIRRESKVLCFCTYPVAPADLIAESLSSSSIPGV